MLGDYGLNDKNISHNNSYLRSLIKFLSDKFLVGIHSSYASAKEYHKLSDEIKRLEYIQKRETLFIRQHFLKILLILDEDFSFITNSIRSCDSDNNIS